MILSCKTYLFFSLCILILHLSSFSQGKIVSTHLTQKEIPKAIPYEGKFKNAIKWVDKSGENIVIITETGEYQSRTESNEDYRDAKLYAYHFSLKNNIFTQTWKIQDFIYACPVDIEAQFIPNTFQITDLNKNGIGEVWLMYKTVCHGDVSPSNMKIIMQEGSKKFAMRGRNRVEYGKGKFEGGEFTFDQAFLTGPSVFRDFAKALWNKNIMQVW